MNLCLNEVPADSVILPEIRSWNGLPVDDSIIPSPIYYVRHCGNKYHEYVAGSKKWDEGDFVEHTPKLRFSEMPDEIFPKEEPEKQAKLPFRQRARKNINSFFKNAQRKAVDTIEVFSEGLFPGLLPRVGEQYDLEVWRCRTLESVLLRFLFQIRSNSQNSMFF